jgi:REP element-mobilizing transposase RayT
MARLLGEGRAFYHVMSRVVDRRMIFGDREKEVFRRILRNQESFTGVRVVTYCLMSNHFHLLLEVPEKGTLAPLDEEGLLEVLPLLYDAETVEDVRQELERARLAGDGRWHQEILDRYERRRGDLSLFLKELKLRVTRYMNKRLDREGTLWQGRFKSVLVEGAESALLTVAAYIDLNPVRAGMVKAPEDYRWSGYGESCGRGRGAILAREGLGRLLGESLREPELRHDWERTAARYRSLLYEEGRGVAGDPQLGQGGRRGFSEAEIEAVRETGGKMRLSEVLRRRVRYFCDGAVLGSATFVEEVFEREQRVRRRFGEKRKTGARRMRGADWGDLRVLRDLRKDVMGT